MTAHCRPSKGHKVSGIAQADVAERYPLELTPSEARETLAEELAEQYGRSRAFWAQHLGVHHD